MRKSCIILVFLFSVVLFVGCSNEHEHTYGEWVITETGHYRPLICDECSQLTVEEKHTDLNDDNKCDECGYVLDHNVHNHLWTWNIEDEIGHIKLFTCGCPSEEGTTPHADFNRDGFCDECNYEMGDGHPIRYSTTETGHSIITLCGCCEAPAVEDPHIDNDGDLMCDICNYELKDNNLLFVIEDKINELTKYKNSILVNINSSILVPSINFLFDDCIANIKNVETISVANELVDKCLKDVYNLIPLANGDFDFSNLSVIDKKGILSLLDDYIFRNNLGGVPISKYYTLNLNSTTKEQWIEFFGEEGSICQTPKNKYWAVKAFLSNEYFLKGLSLALPKEEVLDEGSDFYRIDYSKYEFYDYNLELARKYFAVAMEELFSIYDFSSQFPIELKLEIAFGTKTAENEQLFNTLKSNIETAFNDLSVSNGNFVLIVETWYGEYFGQIYTEKNYKGQFDLSYDKISGSSYDQYMYYNLLSSNFDLSNDLTINWSIDTNSIDDDCIVYNGYRFTYDSLLALLSSKYNIIDGTFTK